MSKKLNTLPNSVERKVRGDKRKEVSWPKSIIVTKEMLKDVKFMEKYPDARLGSEICDPIPIYLRKDEKREPDLIEKIRAEMRREMQEAKQVEEYYAFDKMTPEQQRAFLEDESNFNLPEDSEGDILTPYEQAGIVVDAVPEVPVNEETPLNQTENTPVNTETPEEGGVSGAQTPSPAPQEPAEQPPAA